MASLAENVGWLFGWLLRNSAHAAVLAGVVWGLERTLCRTLSPRWRYGLWLLVVVRLIIPIAPGSPLSLFNLVDLAPGSLGGFLCQILGLPSPVPVSLPESPHPLADTPSWFLGALALWVPGALVLGVLLWRDLQRLHDALGGTPVLDPDTLGLLVQSKAVMCVRREVELVETARMSSPAITGWLRPRLLLPEGLLPRLTRDETRFLFLHELAHVKRWDIALNWVLAVVQVLHWFNPVVWFALRRLLTVREEVCDDLVLRRSFHGAAREYGLTLIRLLEECAPRRLLPAYAGVLDDIRSLRQRVRCIREFTMAETNPWSPAFLTVLVAVVGLTERTHHHALAANVSPAYAEVRGHVRPSLRNRQQPRPIPIVPSPVEIHGQEGIQPHGRFGSAPSLLAMLRNAFERAVRETRGLPAASAEAGREAEDDKGLALATRSLAGAPSVGASGGGGRRVRVVAPMRAGLLPGARPGPLPPIDQRGSILHPGRPAAEGILIRPLSSPAGEGAGLPARPLTVSGLPSRRPES